MLTFDHVRQTMNAISEEVVTLYLHVDPAHRPNQNQTPAWNIFVKNALRNIENDFDIDSDNWKAIQKQVENYLSGYTPNGKTLVLFVGANTLHTHELPIAIENQWAYGDPQVVPLLWAIDEYERYLVVLVDNEQARFLTAYLGYVDAQEEMTIDFDAYDFGSHHYVNSNHGAVVNGSPLSQGASRDSFEDMKSEHIRRFHKDIAEHIRETMRQSSAKRIILGGNERAAHQVQDLLHDSLKEQVVDILSIPMQTDNVEIAEKIMPSATNFEREKEMELVEEVVGFAKANGRGALGYEAVNNAFTMQQVELLLLPYPIDNQDRAADLTMKALKHGSQIELVHGRSAAKLKQDANVAARLYYAIPETEEG